MSTHHDCRRGTRRAGLVMVILVLFVISAAFIPGCLKIAQQVRNDRSEGDPPVIPANQMTAQENSPGHPAVSTAAGPLPPFPEGRQTGTPAQTAMSAPETSPSPKVVREAAPFLTPDPYPVLHGTQFNNTQDFSRLGSTGIEFEKTYVLRGNATGLVVDVTKGPLYIIYEVTPQHDCLMDPGSCQGDMTKPVNRPYLTITVRDNTTKEIVAEDGYGREYSSDTGHATYSNTGKDTADSLLSSATYGDVTTISSPGPRYIKIYKDGVFHITLEGSFLSVNVKIRTGATPDKVQSTVQSSSSPQPTIPPEILQRIRQGV